MTADNLHGWFQVLGRLHLLVLHLPIGLWCGVLCLEFGSALLRRSVPRAAVVALTWFAALAALAAAGTGWVLGLEGDYDAATIDRHRWFGVAFAAVGLLAASLCAFRARQPFRLLLLVVCGVMIPAGHLGGEMTHGTGFLFEPLVGEEAPAPAPDQRGGTEPAAAAAPEPAAAPAEPGPPAPAVVPAGGAPTFATAVAPILESRCTRCHSEQKHKGDLVLATAAGIQKGGKNGPVLAPGDPAGSEILRRLLLPLDDDDHMPPDGKPQPTAAEIALLHAWVAAGAPFTGSFAGTQPGPGKDAPLPGAKPPAQGAPDAPAPTDPAPAQPAPKEPAPKEPAQPVRPAGGGQTGQGGTDGGQAEEAALALLRARLVHVAPLARDSDGLWLDFAAIAPKLTDAEAERLLAPLSARIVDLDLARAPVGDRTLAVCAAMPRLERLDLRGTAVTSEGLLHLRALPALHELVLAQTQLDDRAADAILAMPALQRVYLWNAGLSAPAAARLAARQGLCVDTGATPPDEALAVEGEPKFTNDLPPPGQDPAAAAAAAALRPVNAVCPVTGKPVDARYVIVHGGRAIGFCCPKCPAAFWAEPAKYAVAGR